MNAMDVVKQGGVGGSLAYLMVTAPTEWLAWLPVVPEGHYLPMVGALGTVIAAALRLTGLGNGKPVDPPAA